jgi:hypothetical protein
MNMPGFTAEASVYKTGEYYHMAGAPHVMAGDSTRQARVVASLMRGCTSICKCCENHGTDYCCKTCYEKCPE